MPQQLQLMIGPFFLPPSVPHLATSLSRACFITLASHLIFDLFLVNQSEGPEQSEQSEQSEQYSVTPRKNGFKLHTHIKLRYIRISNEVY